MHSDAKVAYLRCSRDHHNILLYQAEEHGLKRVGFELEQESDVRAAYDHFTKLEMAPVWVPKDEAKQMKQARLSRPRKAFRPLFRAVRRQPAS
ncbi:hypothetical protein ACTMU2_15715 [Cupriavidus basilensis]